MFIISSGVQILGSTFESNEALPSDGGAVNVATGSSAQCRNTSFLRNRAGVGGAVYVRDGSFKGELVDFIGNAVQPGGVGGAAAVAISKGKDIPDLNIDNLQRGSVFQCEFCNFEKNNGSLAGGPAHTCRCLMTAVWTSRRFARS